MNLLILIYFVALPIFSTCKQTVISANFTDFTIWYKLFGLTYWKRHRKIAKIWVDGENNSSGKSVVKIHLGKKTFCTNPMAGVEEQWLIQEITDWLDIRSSNQSV
jgi:hypothetical protein